MIVVMAFRCWQSTVLEIGINDDDDDDELG